MNDLVSIIVPIYNAEKYLLDCLNSIIEQSYKNIEIILVDDGSTDCSKILAQQFCEKHKELNIQLLFKYNGGQSSARNLGIKRATGEYFIFIDSDDMIGTSHVEILLSAVKELKVALAMCKFTKNLEQLSNTVYTEKTLLKGDFLFLVETLYKSDYHAVSASGKIYHCSLLKKIQFYEGIIYEDGLFFYEIINKVNEIVLVDAVSYYYRTSENSTLTSVINEKNYDILKKNELTLAFFEKNHLEALNHFYNKAMNVNDFMAVKCKKDNTVLSKDLFKKLYAQNKKYSRDFFPRKIIYTTWVGYYMFISVISKFYDTNQPENTKFIKHTIKKILK